MKRSKTGAKLLLLLLFLTSISKAIADTTAFQFANATDKGGALAGGGFAITVSTYIEVNEDVTVTHLGFEVQGAGQTSNAVGIFAESTGELLVAEQVSVTDPTDGLYYYKQVTPTMLHKGSRYYVAAFLPYGQRYIYGTNATTTPCRDH